MAYDGSGPPEDRAVGEPPLGLVGAELDRHLAPDPVGPPDARDDHVVGPEHDGHADA